jgi:PhnB protein
VFARTWLTIRPLTFDPTPARVSEGKEGAAFPARSGNIATSARRRSTPVSVRSGVEGKIGHAELEIGDSVIMLADANADMDVRSPKSIGGTPIALHVYVEDVDSVFGRAMEAGAKQLRPIENQFYGDRSGQFEDPFGHRWNVATHVEDVPPDEMATRAAAAMAAG